jgi:hypothetical protein
MAAYCSVGGTCAEKASKAPPAIARKPVPSKGQRRHAAAQQPPGGDVADDVDGGGKRRERAGPGAGQAGLGIDGRQETHHREPLP